MYFTTVPPVGMRGMAGRQQPAPPANLRHMVLSNMERKLTESE